MIQLIKKIESNFVTEIKGNLVFTGSIKGEVQREDYVNIYGFTAFLQNFSRTPITISVTKPNSFGYKIPIGITQKTIEINY
jgi:hypothetical protein